MAAEDVAVKSFFRPLGRWDSVPVKLLLMVPLLGVLLWAAASEVARLENGGAKGDMLGYWLMSYDGVTRNQMALKAVVAGEVDPNQASGVAVSALEGMANDLAPLVESLSVDLRHRPAHASAVALAEQLRTTRVWIEGQTGISPEVQTALSTIVAMTDQHLKDVVHTGAWRKLP